MVHQPFEAGPYNACVVRNFEFLQPLNQTQNVPMIPTPVNNPGKCLKNSVARRLSTSASVVKTIAAGIVDRNTVALNTPTA